ncbi:hypothetical protein AB0I66_21365 [Streptomyces sp. NPDC050439]|uniref:hypothetical protein n=1 Tax=unclassified Streptomyces TaxID=2593676 RepID=UPI00341C891E
MNALADIAAIVRHCATDFLDTRYDMDAEPGDIAEQLYAAVRAEVLPEAASVADKHADRAVDRLTALAIRNVADEQRRMVEEKASATAPTATPHADPIVVRWDRTVMHPEADDIQETIVCCLDEAGRPYALFLDDEHREALGLLLVDPGGDEEAELTGRLAQLLNAIRTWPGQWTTTRAMAVYRAQGLQEPNRSTARGDLQALAEAGHLVCCGPENARYYLLARKDGS